MKRMGQCKYCGKEIKKKSNLYCDRTCFILFLGNSARLIVENMERANKMDTFILIDLPLFLYNKFFTRNVERNDYIVSLQEIMKKSLPSMEYKLLIGYYNASKKRKETYIPLSMVRSALASPKMFRVMASNVDFDFKTSVGMAERIKIEHDEFINGLSRKSIIDDETRKKMLDLHERLGMDQYMKQIGDGVATAYVAGMLARARIKQQDVETISRKKMVTIRLLSSRIIDDMKKKNKIILPKRFTGDIKNLPAAIIV